MEMQRKIGKVKKVNGPVIQVKDVTDAKMMETVFVGSMRLTGEIVKLNKDTATIEVYEDATGIKPGDEVFGTGMALSVALAPGLIGSIFDGIERPLDKIRSLTGTFIERGINVAALDEEKLWSYKSLVKEGDKVRKGSIIGEIKENKRIKHFVMVPPDKTGEYTVINASSNGEYKITDQLALLKSEDGKTHRIQALQYWPIRVPRPYFEKLSLDVPLITGLRVIDTLFPLAKGGSVAIPGGFGTGKTMTQHSIAQWCDADIIVYIGCGERGNEMTDVLREFPNLTDPRTGESLMERTILIANTSNMPVSAREASIYTGITIAEYYRDMGYSVALMADSTSRWAEALRELSGRMEEMPAEEGFPAYLATRIAEFYERAGRVETLSEKEGSISVIGAVSPPGGDFSEPVTQNTKRFVRCFWGLDRALASSRHYPAINWLESYSEYVDDVKEWWEEKSGDNWSKNRSQIMDLLHKEVRLNQIVKLVGPDALPDSQNFIIEVCSCFKTAFLQQNAFDKIDRYCSAEKQAKMLSLILNYYKLGKEAIKSGVPLVKLRRLDAVKEIVKIRFTVSNDEINEIDRIEDKLESSVKALEGL